MVTMVGLEADFEELAKDLTRLDYDAIEAYEEAIARVDDIALKDKLSEFMLDHRRHTEELSALLREFGQEPPTGPGGKRFLTKGKVMMADLIGERAILRAMLSNEQDTNSAYERAAEHDDMPEAARDIIRRGLADERRHRDWLRQMIDSMS